MDAVGEIALHQGSKDRPFSLGRRAEKTPREPSELKDERARPSKRKARRGKRARSYSKTAYRFLSLLQTPIGLLFWLIAQTDLLLNLREHRVT
jgi:hypothetical protein